MSSIKKLYYKILNKETISYLIFGVLTTIINYGIYELCKVILKGDSNEITTSIIMTSTVISWVIAVLFAFITNKLWVFNSKSMEINIVIKEFIAFVSARLFSGGCDILWMYVTVDIFKFNDSAAKILSNVFIVIINYFFSKIFIFKNNKE